MRLGERLKIARKRAGLSLRALAECAEVSAQAISKYERGLDAPGSDVLIRLSKSLGVSLEWLLRPIGPESCQLEPAYCSRWRRLAAWQRAEIKAQASEWIERYLTLEDILGERLTFVLPEISRRVKQEDEIEEVAEGLRQAWNLGQDGISDLIAVLDTRGIRVGVISGVGRFGSITFRLPSAQPVIIVEGDIPGDHQRLSLAREIGRLILETPEGWSKERVESAVCRFAGAFLAPRAAVRRELGTWRARLDLYELCLLKHRYGLSMQGWVYRARDLGVISRAAAEAWRRRFREMGWHDREPGDLYPPERTTRLERLVLRGLAEGYIGESRAAELLGRPSGDFLGEARRKYEGYSRLSRV